MLRSFVVVLALAALSAATRDANDPVHLAHQTGFAKLNPAIASELAAGRTAAGTKIEKPGIGIDLEALGIKPQGYTAFGTPIMSPSKLEKTLINQQYKCTAGVCCDMVKKMFKKNTEQCDEDPLQPCMQPAGLCPGGAAFCSKMEAKPDMTLCPGGVCKAGVCQLRPCKEGQCCISGRNRPDGMKCEGGSCSKGECVPAPVAPAPVAVNIAPVAPVAAPAPTATPVSSPVKLVLPKLSKNASPAEIKAARRVARLLRESHSKQDKETLAIYKKIEQQVKKTEKKRAKKNLSK
eukprot:TRINITY_DN248_c0_g1_i1.p1 TRINITY_DN248_c0_g1~~TRINITY_DN248_c0_g1_i1.p1  ORF type:complete len:305 (-),score=78.09 TRINITY_DN248_c0_g1_i1:116-991(-)